ncbi:pten [Tritrichomonas foetus]|uniref:Phosphatidylinositol 3,4,5-trisphosphate 3-phosphatase and dual-specificity protein phosphatase PTEN n=1 Tax=Tritrichomonas foetus TaxID=1144522 RepID=A0A1J4L3T5_9EUKA|nr:pten [Tritrichomonas foetus]|eukprot:OHT16581.1 pten [Tritrichomonas foetus]
MRQFCIHAQNWLDEDKKHIIAVHCKAGKGRTGLMIVCLLLHMGRFESCDEALTYYGKKRTYNGKGVTIPSQIRYAYYYEQYLKGGFPRDQEFVGKPCTVTCVHFRNVPDEFFTRDLILEICAIDDETIYYKGPGKNPKGPRKNSEHNTLTYKLDGLEECENIAGDFRISIFKGEKMACFMWFNSEFIKDKEVFTKAQIDKANKNKVFKKDFKACVFAHH